MSYQVLARKWRPQRFGDVVGQEAVTRTLRNAITGGRVAQAFVFAGARGCGKTTTARILARALSCVKGPTADPCGECDACVEIAQGRDIDVLEIDAASHTGIDNIREVVIAGLSIAPVRNRYKVFIIDEVHQLSASSFNALLKSIEEPPAHVVFMMATTELNKIPDTILSRSQVFEFRTIPTRAIAGQLRTIADAEGIEVPDPALALIARSAEGSMRDAQSAFDQVISFAGNTITGEDVSTVLGLVGRDLLFDLIESVVDEDAPRAFALADRAVESGYELKLVYRELARVVRDMTIVSIDPSRVGDEEIGETERERLVALAQRFSREDLMRAFDVLSRAEQEIRTAAQPRYHFEMALLRWMHLRKLVPLAELLAGGAGATGAPGRAAAVTRTVSAPAVVASRTSPATPTRPSAGMAPAARVAAAAPSAAAASAPVAGLPGAAPSGSAAGSMKDVFLAEIRGTKSIFYNIVVAQAQKIEVTADRITFSFLPTHRALREQFEQAREWLEQAAARVAGRKISVVAAQLPAPEAGTSSQDVASDGAPGQGLSSQGAPTLPGSVRAPAQPPKPAPGASRDLKAEALSSSAVQAMLDVFPAEIRDVEEM
ncbi:MAG: DNA polymerase III subunit gamma/tau [Acidobacteria bacterium]|nr:DNA polymerase III subunit gamma/tau [Acidobacteriota bacterium]